MLCPLRLEVDPLVIGSPWPITQTLIKQHCRIDSSEEDALIEAYLKAAVQWAENATHRNIFSRTVVWTLKEFPSAGRMEIALPRGKTQSVTSVEYVNGGTTYTLSGPSDSPAGTDFREDLGGEDGGSLFPLRNGTWPDSDWDAPAPVKITFEAGWMDAEIPSDLIHAILFAIEDAYDIRGSQDFQPGLLASTGPRFAARESLISGYRLSRLY